MGWEWEVEAWVQLDESGYRWMPIYQGNSKRQARKAAGEARRNATGAIRTTWRPS